MLVIYLQDMFYMRCNLGEAEAEGEAACSRNWVHNSKAVGVLQHIWTLLKHEITCLMKFTWKINSGFIYCHVLRELDEVLPIWFLSASMWW